jgi:protocadherin Fat 1/2/3
VQNNNNMRSTYKLHVRASDGAFSTVALVKVRVERSENSGLAFHKDVYYGSITENSTKIMTVAVVNVLGSALNEHLVFRILNPTDMFSIGATSGAIKTTGKRFDREEKDSYELIVEVRVLKFRGCKFLSVGCFVRRRVVTRTESTGRAWRTCS